MIRPNRFLHSKHYRIACAFFQCIVISLHSSENDDFVRSEHAFCVDSKRQQKNKYCQASQSQRRHEIYYITFWYLVGKFQVVEIVQHKMYCVFFQWMYWKHSIWMSIYFGRNKKNCLFSYSPKLMGHLNELRFYCTTDERNTENKPTKK